MNQTHTNQEDRGGCMTDTTSRSPLEEWLEMVQQDHDNHN